MSNFFARDSGSDETPVSQLGASLTLLQETGTPWLSFPETVSHTSEDQNHAAAVVPMIGNAARSAESWHKVPRPGTQDSIQNESAGRNDNHSIAGSATIGGGAVNNSPSFVAISRSGAGAPIRHDLSAGGAFSPARHQAALPPRLPNEVLTVDVSAAGNSDGNDNDVIIGSGNSGSFNGNGNLIAIGNGNGVTVSTATNHGLPLDFNALTASGGANVSDDVSSNIIVPVNLAQYLAASGFTALPEGHGHQQLPLINLVFEPIQITVTDAGNNDGNGNTIAVGSGNSGYYDGNGNEIAIGNGNGVSISVLNPAGVRLLTKQVQLNVSGSGNNDGNGNEIAIGSWNGTSHNGNDNAVLIGNGNGVAF